MKHIFLIELRNETYNWAKKFLIGKNIRNINIPKIIEINRAGIKHTLWKNYKNENEFEKNKAQIELTKKLFDLINNAEYQQFKRDKKGRDNIIGFHILENEINFKGEKYKVIITIRETAAKTYFYDHSLIK